MERASAPRTICGKVACGLGVTLVLALASAGCGNQKSNGTELTAKEKAALQAPLGQPMPPEAAAAMAKMRKGPAGGAPPASAASPSAK